jgi:hypothetical protein
MSLCYFLSFLFKSYMCVHTGMCKCVCGIHAHMYTCVFMIVWRMLRTQEYTAFPILCMLYHSLHYVLSLSLTVKFSILARLLSLQAVWISLCLSPSAGVTSIYDHMWLLPECWRFDLRFSHFLTKWSWLIELCSHHFSNIMLDVLAVVFNVPSRISRL